MKLCMIKVLTLVINKKTNTELKTKRLQIICRQYGKRWFWYINFIWRILQGIYTRLLRLLESTQGIFSNRFPTIVFNHDLSFESLWNRDWRNTSNYMHKWMRKGNDQSELLGWLFILIICNKLKMKI